MEELRMEELKRVEMDWMQCVQYWAAAWAMG